MSVRRSEDLPIPSVQARTVVRDMDRSDAGFSGHLHRDALGVGLYPRLGWRFLRAYHLSFIDSPYALALLATSDGQRVGVLLGTLDTARHHAWLVHHRSGRLLGRAALAIVVRPVVLAHFTHTRVGRYLRLLRDTIALPPDEQIPPLLTPAVLCHTAVIAPARGTGIGGALEQEFEVRLRAAGDTVAVLLTETGGVAHAFYASHGWAVAGHGVDADGVALTRYRKDL